MIRLKGITLSRGGRTLLAEADASIAGGERVALIGRNGSGKSTLLAAIAGDVPLDAGAIELPPQRIARLSQQAPRGPMPALEWVLAADADWSDTRARLDAAEAAGDAVAQAELHARMADLDGYSAPARAAQLLDGLGFAPADAARPVDAFSGGWKMRLNLARVLMTPAELLLLDEPTNHLDLDAIVWLQDWLAAFQGSAIIVSHDREFVDAVAHAVLHLAGAKLRRYAGGYSAFETAAAAEADRIARLQAAQQQRVAHLQSFIERFRAKATKARQAQSRMKALERMTAIAALPRESHATFRFDDVGEGPDPLVVAERLDAGYGHTAIVRGATLAVERGARVGVLGRNGAGKSTLIRTLVRELPALAGEVRHAKDLRIGYFAQQQIEQLRDEDTPLLHLARMWPQARPQQLRDWLGGFGFGGERADSPIGPFSGGEKSRLALASIAALKPHLLVLDEPTNHLDADARDALALALSDFDGALLLVSHDRHLLRATVDRFVIVHDGAIEPFDGSLEDYRQWLAQPARAAGVASGTSAASAVGASPIAAALSRREERARAAEARRRQAEQRRPLQQALARLEAELAELSGQAARLDAQLGDPAFYGNADRAAEAARARGQIAARTEAVEQAWLETHEQLDALQAQATDD